MRQNQFFDEFYGPNNFDPYCERTHGKIISHYNPKLSQVLSKFFLISGIIIFMLGAFILVGNIALGYFFIYLDLSIIGIVLCVTSLALIISYPIILCKMKARLQFQQKLSANAYITEATITHLDNLEIPERQYSKTEIAGIILSLGASVSTEKTTTQYLKIKYTFQDKNGKKRKGKETIDTTKNATHLHLLSKHYLQQNIGIQILIIFNNKSSAILFIPKKEKQL